MKLDNRLFTKFRTWLGLQKDLSTSNVYCTQTVKVIEYIRFYQRKLGIRGYSNWGDMIRFDDMLSGLEDIMTFKLEQQLLKLVKKFEENRNIEE